MKSHKSAIILLVLLLCALGLVTGFKYFEYINKDPSFCTMCHLTEEGYASWEKSSHYTLICQECHTLSILEGNKLLLGHYVKGDKNIKQTHGRIKPWEQCIKCHNTEAAQGSITFRKSYGHARHVFMQDISCKNCHTDQMHKLDVNSKKCQSCHQDKLVHGMGTAGTVCLNCHNFTSAKENFISSERCFNCHETVPKKGVMAKIECHECHHPHTKLEFKSENCLGTCHSSEAKVGQHSLHVEQEGLACLTCHKPHSWEVKKANAKGLCDKCHPMKDPLSFIYYSPKASH